MFAVFPLHWYSIQGFVTCRLCGHNRGWTLWGPEHLSQRVQHWYITETWTCLLQGSH